MAMKIKLASLILSLISARPALAAIDLNSATRAELEAAKGIGPAKAQAIMTYREKNGPFKQLEELARIKGFGKATVNKLKPQFTTAGTKTGDRTAK